MSAAEEEQEAPLTREELQQQNDELHDELDDKTAELKALQENLTVAINSIKTFHDQQRQLYSEFVALHKKYAAQKTRNRSTLWDFVPANCPGFDKLPLCTTDVYETEDFVDSYKLHEHIGEGQFGEVRRAEDLSLPCNEGDDGGDTAGRTFSAIKIIDKYKITDITNLTRIVAELSALQTLDHPNVLTLADVIHSPDYLYIVTEYGGHDLFEYFETHSDGVPEAQARHVAQMIVAGVSHMHAHHFCHRDLKPENILYDPEAGTLQVIDFGLCADLSKSNMLSDFCGSPGFLAPEIITAAQYNGQKADYWSIGCILLELLVGHKVFEKMWMPAYELGILREKEVFQNRIHNTLGRVRKAARSGVLEKFSSPCKQVLMGLLDPEPMQRITIAELQDDEWLDLPQQPGGSPSSSPGGLLARPPLVPHSSLTPLDEMAAASAASAAAAAGGGAGGDSGCRSSGGRGRPGEGRKKPRPSGSTGLTLQSHSTVDTTGWGRDPDGSTDRSDGARAPLRRVASQPTSRNTSPPTAIGRRSPSAESKTGGRAADQSQQRHRELPPMPGELSPKTPKISSAKKILFAGAAIANRF